MLNKERYISIIINSYKPFCSPISAVFKYDHLKNFCFSRSNLWKRSDSATRLSLTDSSKLRNIKAMFCPMSSSILRIHSG